MSAIPTCSSLQFLTYLRSFVQDIRQAQLLIVPSAENLSRTNKLIASLFGCVVLSASILRGQAGAKLSYIAGLRRKVRVFASDAFQQEAPSLTVVLRNVCERPDSDWQAVSFQDARRKDGWKWGIVLRGATENVPKNNTNSKKLLCLTGNGLVAWATREFGPFLREVAGFRVVKGDAQWPSD